MNRPPPKPETPFKPEDAALFRAAVGGVQPLPEQNRVEPHNLPRTPPLHARTAPDALPDTLSDSAAGDAPDEFLRNGLSRMTLRKLRRQPVQDRLDLHGNTTEAARKLLQAFLHEAARRGLRCVLVIHGKGMNSPGGEAVLRRLARHWLMQRTDVLAFCDAPSGEGGSGAALVLLKARASREDVFPE